MKPDIYTYSKQPPHLIWLALTGIAALIGLAANGTIAAILLATMGLSLPCLLPILVGWRERDSEVFQVLGWTLVAVLAVSTTGGMRSPLTILFVLGPLTGLVVGRPQVAAESSAFSAISFFCLWSLNAWLTPPQPPDSLLAYIAAVGLAAITYSGILCVMAVRRWTRLAPDIPVFSADQPSQRVSLPEPVPFAVLSVTQLGRVRWVEGNAEIKRHLRVGATLERGFDALEAGFAVDLVRETSAEGDLDPNGTGYRMWSAPTDTGAVLVIQKTDHLASDERAALEAEHADALSARTSFFASLGHDLKTPLNAIIGFSDMMRSGIRGPLPEAYDEYADIIHESGQDLLLMVEDLLDLAKADTQKLILDFEPVDLMASAASVARQLSGQAQRAGVTLDLQSTGETWARADARAVRQIWQNLLSNAIKFSADGSSITLTAGARSGKVVLSVIDQGEGMDKADLDRLAEPFARGRNARGRAGTGLGLAVVKQFADLHGGQVRVETARGEGTRVDVTFHPADPDHVSGFKDAAQ